MHYETRYCTHCATPLQWVIQAEDGGDVSRLRCPECGWTHWNNPCLLYTSDAADE